MVELGFKAGSLTKGPELLMALLWGGTKEPQLGSCLVEIMSILAKRVTQCIYPCQGSSQNPDSRQCCK